MKNITTAQFIDIVKGVKSSFVSLSTETAQSIFNKKDRNTKEPMLEAIGMEPDRILKNTKLVCLIGNGVTYQDMVSHRLVKENPMSGVDMTFEAGELPWGHWVDGAEKILIENKGEFYLRVYCVANNKPAVSYSYDGEPIDEKESRFDGFRKPEKKEGNNQGLEKPIVVRTYKVSSIKEATINGETYKIS